MYDPQVKKTIVHHNDLCYEEIIETPVGTINQIIMKNESNYGEYPKKWFLESKDDFYVQMWLEEHTEMVFNEKKI